MTIGTAPTGKFGINQKVLDLFSSASDIFGGADARSVFAGNDSGQAQEAVRASLKGLERELNRLLGYKSDFTAAERKKLDDLKARIAKIDTRAKESGFTADQIEERARLYQEAYRIMGKDYVDVAGNEELQELTDKVDTLLEPKLRGAKKERLERLRKLENTHLDALVANPGNETVRARLRSVKAQISKLVPPRDIKELSPAERRDYDDLVEKINRLARTEYLLDSKKRMRAEQIQTSMSELQAQAEALGVGAQTPSAGAVARAYARFL